MRTGTQPENFWRPTGRRVVALIVTGAIVSACAPVGPPAYPFAVGGADYPPPPAYRPMWSAANRPISPPPYAFARPVTPDAGDTAPGGQEQATQTGGSGVEHDLLLGGAGYLAGRQFATKPPTPAGTAPLQAGETAVSRGAPLAADASTTGSTAAAATVGAVERAGASRALTTTVGRTAVAGAAEFGAGEAAIGAGAGATAGEVGVAAGIGEVLVPGLLILGAGYLAYRLLTDSNNAHCANGERGCQSYK